MWLQRCPCCRRLSPCLSRTGPAASVQGTLAEAGRVSLRASCGRRLRAEHHHGVDPRPDRIRQQRRNPVHLLTGLRELRAAGELHHARGDLPLGHRAGLVAPSAAPRTISPTLATEARDQLETEVGVPGSGERLIPRRRRSPARAARPGSGRPLRPRRPISSAPRRPPPRPPAVTRRGAPNPSDSGRCQG